VLFFNVFLNLFFTKIPRTRGASTTGVHAKTQKFRLDKLCHLAA